ncbi:MAG TPA: type II toxin-antitoxin system prevent-host-death family antitoxin [Terracidiphilus sp.]|jgi:prevent-host-death family protein|nr:type II toxin-antitoxin system prevent-host-death family antitoxin [Terracidiphilus sp.]
MKTVNIGTLRNKLSAYLQDVRNGEEVIVQDRKKPIARIVPIRPADFSEEELYLASIGVLKLPKDPGGIDWEAFKKLPMPEVPDEAVKEALDWVRGKK